MKTNENCSCGNVYVNYCCPDGNGGASFLGTKVYVDSRNTNESPDGSVNNPFATLEDAFAYVDSTDESYIVHIINAGEKPSVEYTFTKKGNLSIVGDSTFNNMQGNIALYLSLHFQNLETLVSVDSLSGNFKIYGGQDISFNNILSNHIELYDTNNIIHMNNCGGIQGDCYVKLAYEVSPPSNDVLLTNLLITNSSVNLTVDRRVYYAWARNSSITAIQSSLLEPIESLIQFMLNDCFIGYIQRDGALEKSYFSLTSCWLNGGVDADDLYVEIDTDLSLPPRMNVTNYTPERNSLLSHLEAIDKKLGELQTRFDSL